MNTHHISYIWAFYKVVQVPGHSCGKERTYKNGAIALCKIGMRCTRNTQLSPTPHSSTPV